MTLLILKGLSVIAYMFLERWLGRTTKTSANSFLDLVFKEVPIIIKSIQSKKLNGDK